MPAVLTKLVDRVPELLKGVEELTAHDVLVGIPSAKTARKGEMITNASLAYIHEYGSPAQNIPARPFLIPGVKAIRKEALAMLRQGALDVMQGKATASVVLNKVGILARNSVVEHITDPDPPFAPLAPSTVRARLRRTQAGRRKLRGIKADAAQAGVSMSMALTQWGEGNLQPLIDTGQLRASITYVVR